MAATTSEETRRRRRARLVRGLAFGVAALGAPWLYRRWREGRFERLPLATWGRAESYLWRGQAIAVQRVGQGEPVVLLHSLGPGHDSEEWHGVAEHLAPDREVIALDLPGWGRSADVDLPLSALTCSDLVTDFLIEVVREPAVLIGAGRSAGIALAVADRAETRLRALGLVAPIGLGRGRGDAVDGRAGEMVRRVLELPVVGPAGMQLFTSRAAIQHHLRTEVFAAPERAHAGIVDHHHRSARQPGAEAALAAWLTGRFDARAAGLAAPAPSLPVWIAWGRQSQHPPVEDADLWLQRLPQAEIDVFEEAGALPHLESATEFAHRLEAFLAS